MLWGGRFKEELNNEAFAFSSSIQFDIALFGEEILCGKAYAKMLNKIRILTSAEKDTILAGLEKVKDGFEKNPSDYDLKKYEDVHSFIESRLYEEAGETAGKLRSGRSRNDQIATSFRMWIKKSIKEIIELQSGLQKTLLQKAEAEADTIIPGYTHTQHAQPVTVGHHLLAYINMLERDKELMSAAYKTADVLPLGAGALAGSTLPLDIEYLREELNFSSVCRNSIDAVSDRDFALQFLNAASQCMMHLSRLCEEFILWSSQEWSLITIGDSFTTGSSLMPQKKNPDICELIRGKSARVFSNYQSILTMMKALPLSYNRDMQEDKVPVFESSGILSSSLFLLSGMIGTVVFNNTKALEGLEKGFSLATDVADWLVLKGIPFRKAHDLAGKLVLYCAANNKKFSDLTEEEFTKILTVFDQSIFDLFPVSKSLGRKKTASSPNPEFIRNQLAQWKKSLGV